MSSPHSNGQEDDDDHSIWQRFLLPNFLDTEEIENYEPGGFHPVHLGDTYDNGRYRIVHKLGSGGFATVWLARDESEKKWVALKIFLAKHSVSVGKQGLHVYQDAELRRFTIQGPNGAHLCIVSPVLGPSCGQLSSGFTCRLKPWLARRAGYQAAKAVATLHAQDLCHGDITTANILFELLDFDQLGEGGIYRLLEPPVTGVLETESGEPTGPEAPQYIVKNLDFLSSTSNIISNDVRLIDFDECFSISSPPERMLKIPPEFLAPEVAVGLPAGLASDVWALGCCIFILRSGEGPFSGYEVTSPADLMRIVRQTIGDMPPAWQDTLWDRDGQPTEDPGKGAGLAEWEGEQSLEGLVSQIWDQPEGNIVETGRTWPELEESDAERNMPFPSCFADMVWKPSAVKVDNVYLYGYNDGSDALLEVMPKIPEQEAALLYDLLSKIFVYDPRSRPTASEILKHSWFHMGRQLE
ncbi:kinase-like protein [Xylaria palmicola]|nr:kinase-like protein [Xylaria palmicola]